MKCPVCIEQKTQSTVQSGGSSVTLLGSPAVSFDKEGRRHSHDNNTTTTTYTCGLGHNFVVSYRGVCWCGWGKGRWKVSVALPGTQVKKDDRVITQMRPILDDAVIKTMFEVKP